MWVPEETQKNQKVSLEVLERSMESWQWIPDEIVPSGTPSFSSKWFQIKTHIVSKAFPGETIHTC